MKNGPFCRARGLYSLAGQVQVFVVVTELGAGQALLPAMPSPLMASFACRAFLALIANTWVLSTPSSLVALLPTKSVTSRTSSLSPRMSTLLTMKTTFLPHWRMYFRNLVSLSVNGLSAQFSMTAQSICSLCSPEALVCACTHAIG